MSTEIKIPTVGESITEVTISKWLKQEGEFVELDEVICELESEKATFELNAETAGILHLKAKEGDTLKIGDIICEIEANGASAKPEAPAKQEAKKEATSQKPVEATKPVKGSAEQIEMKIPTVGESITEVTISSWLKENGDHVQLDEVIAEIESEKATFELTAEAEGTIEILVPKGETIQIGTVVCKIAVGEGAAETASKPETKPKEDQATTTTEKSYAAGHASPAAAKILSEKDIKSSDVQGSGVDGRITKEDAQKAERQQTPAQQPPKQEPKKQTQTESSSAEGQASGNRNQRKEKMTTLRKTVSRRLVAVKNETAMLTTFNEVDMKPIMDLRSKYKEVFKEKYEVGLGFMSFFAKAICVALKEWPAVNAQISGDEIIYSDFCDVSIAVSTPRGLVVPVIRNAEQMSFDQIEKEIIRLAKKARDGKLSIEEMTGGTFTITNGGVFGSMMSTPIINSPQSAILGMHNIVERPVVVDGEIVIRPIMYVALSYDHRIIDGRESVSFLVRVKQLLEDPARLLLGV